MAKLVRMVGLYRWYGYSAVLVIIAVLAVVKVAVPVAKSSVDRSRVLARESALLGDMAGLERKIAFEQQRSAHIDSVLERGERRPAFDEAAVVAVLYALADSVGCTAGKVEISTAVALDGSREIPLTFRGQGSYRAIGKFVEGVENMDYVTRVRMIQIKHERGDLGSVGVDFVIVE